MAFLLGVATNQRKASRFFYTVTVSLAWQGTEGQTGGIIVGL